MHDWILPHGIAGPTLSGRKNAEGLECVAGTHNLANFPIIARPLLHMDAWDAAVWRSTRNVLFCMHHPWPVVVQKVQQQNAIADKSGRGGRARQVCLWTASALPLRSRSLCGHCPGGGHRVTAGGKPLPAAPTRIVSSRYSIPMDVPGWSTFAWIIPRHWCAHRTCA
jgi:hypothetical protein